MSVNITRKYYKLTGTAAVVLDVKGTYWGTKVSCHAITYTTKFRDEQSPSLFSLCFHLAFFV
jgi:hypothetical protein